MIARHKNLTAELREAILTGKIAPGERLLQVDLAERYGVSRIPLREALRTLHAEGLVVIEPNRGTICRPLGTKDIADLYAVRSALEELAVRAAAERRADIRQETEELHAHASEAAQRRDLRALITLDRDFHALAAANAGNPHLVRSLGHIWSQTMRAMHYFFALDLYPEDVWEQHVALARAIAIGEPELAATLLRAHIGSSQRALHLV